MAYGNQLLDASARESPEVSLSGSLSPTTLVATTTDHYPATTAPWSSYAAPQGASPSSYGDSLPMPGYGSGGEYYPSEGEWSRVRNSFSRSPAEAFDLPLHGASSGVGSHGYSTPGDAYSYAYPSELNPSAEAHLLDHVVSSSTSRTRSSRHRDSVSSSRSRRVKYPLSPPSVSSSTKSTTSKLRSASRASKNTHLNPPQTEEERKNRASHNQVEKQYRNRLNAHFEALLNTLPEYMRGGDIEDEEGDRKISKAEVLEMARRHITSLERDYAAIENERDELKDTVERLKWMLTSRGDGVNVKGP
ncbi:hypothetical protein JX266_006285 [Neoarthrinium moseri]|uniref:uncharacterized protein n=1 Tax=Neoarthrinium moseri TaxID=1658444 RepID=UPI001FDE8197|nr:uncharacterized protein JN550_006614 [Neoarthrinium moseri]KAI1847790.1 hypothetical protein JX266_006285 [Neoarthrinium moseri]KAI1868126.1 hypothetical protein JN550_006614 [Neoarthrinium moseri]